LRQILIFLWKCLVEFCLDNRIEACHPSNRTKSTFQSVSPQRSSGLNDVETLAEHRSWHGSVNVSAG
jgi:hypothetical protein